VAGVAALAAAGTCCAPKIATVARTLIAAVVPLPLLKFIAGMLQEWGLARQLEQKKLTSQAGRGSWDPTSGAEGRVV
jgi:hypothetical protein